MKEAAADDTIHTDRELMEIALELAAKCPLPERIQPKASAVLARDGRLLACTYRGKEGPGTQVEFAILNGKLADVDLEGSTLYLTLEPFASGVLSNTDMIIQRKIRRVFIATLNPDPASRGLGELHLQQAGVEIGRFDPDLAQRFLEMNKPFSRLHPVEPVIRRGHFPEKSPRGYAVGLDVKGNKVEYAPDAREPSGYRAVILHRGSAELQREYLELQDIAVWQIYQILRELRNVVKYPQEYLGKDHDQLAREAQETERRYRRDRLPALDDYHFGLTIGRLSGIAWSCGEEEKTVKEVLADALWEMRSSLRQLGAPESAVAKRGR